MILLLLSLVLLFVATWIVVPAPTYWLLVLAVGATEYSPWLFIASGLTAGLATMDYRRHRAALAVALVAMSLNSIPLVRFPSTARRFDEAMRQGLGDLPPGDLSRGDLEDARNAMRPSPLVVADLFLGLPAAAVRETHGVIFAKPDGVSLSLDIYRPVAEGSFPALVQIYGGAWQRGAPGDNPEFARYFAARGYVVFALDYRHAPRWQWPAQLEDVRAGLMWIRDYARAYGVDEQRLAVMGRSSGAQLAMLAAYGQDRTIVRAVVSYYGPVDLAEGYRHPPRPDPLDVRSIQEAFLGGSPDEVPSRYRDASPITYAVRPQPPTLLIYGGRDHVVQPRLGVMLHQRLRSSGSHSVYLEIPWGGHAFDAVPYGPSGQLALYHTERFLARVLGP